MHTLYADEDCPGPLVRALRALGYDVLTVPQDKRCGNDDPAVLTRATELGRAVLTKNRCDFHALHATTPTHCGIITFTDDADREALAGRIHAAIDDTLSLANELVRVCRPNVPSLKVS